MLHADNAAKTSHMEISLKKYLLAIADYILGHFSFLWIQISFKIILICKPKLNFIVPVQEMGNLKGWSLAKL